MIHAGNSCTCPPEHRKKTHFQSKYELFLFVFANDLLTAHRECAVRSSPRVCEQTETDCGGEIKPFIHSVVSLSYRTVFAVAANCQ